MELAERESAYLPLPLNFRPGTDLNSKLLLNDKRIINLIVTSLLGKCIPNNIYYSAQTEWSDGSKSDVLYVPKTGVTNASVPILIEIQDCVDRRFMSRLIRYCTYVFDRYNVLPVVLVVVVKGFSSIKFEQQFDTNSNHTHLLEIECKCWAKSCSFISPNSIKEHIKENPMDPLVALAYYMTSQSQRLESLVYNTDPIVQLLYAISSKAAPKGGTGIEKAVMMNEFLEETESKLQKIIGLEDEDPGVIVKKSHPYVEEVLNDIENQKRKFKDDDFEPTGSQMDRNTKKYNPDDYLFIEALSEAGKYKNWKTIYDKGKSKGLFQSYTSPNTLKSSYYQAKKRTKNSK